MSRQLYPPVIKGVLPAFYLNYSQVGRVLRGGNLTVPFNMNNSVSESQFTGFSLRIRTASTSSYVLPPIYSNSYDITKGEVIFSFSAKQASYLNEGQYYKIQIAYCASEIVDGAGNLTGGDIGYYSTVGIAKCTSKPEVTIKNLVFENINSFNNELFGLYDLTNCKDRTEKVYSYEFKVYDEDENIFLESDEIIHQSSYDTDYTQSIDRILLNDFASTDTVYSIEYTVHTINDLTLSSPKYRVSSQYLVESNDKIQIFPSNDTENGIITLHFKGAPDPNRSYYFITYAELLNTYDLDEEGKPCIDSCGRDISTLVKEDVYEKYSLNKVGFLRSHSIYRYRPQVGGWIYTFLDDTPKSMTYVPTTDRYYHTEDIKGLDIINPSEEVLQILNSIDNYEFIMEGNYGIKAVTYEYMEDNCIDPDGELILGYEESEKKYFGSYLISRASDEDNYTTWFNLGRIKIYDDKPSKYILKDTTIEHGRKYKYAIQQYNVWGLYSARTVTEPFEARFEDMILTDGEITLKIKYNPKVSSFKTTVLEQKTDTIGGKYPFITRNGATFYKEFPIGGLLAQELDDHHYFVDPEWNHVHRHSSSTKFEYDEEKQEYYLTKEQPRNALWDSHDYSDTTIALERNFKIKVLDWLNDGKPKLFRSPYEGNYIVRLMNSSLTPVEELGRKLHSFQSQAYEIAECNYENLINFGFLKIDTFSDFIDFWKSYNLADDTFWDEEKKNVMITATGGIRHCVIQDMMPGDMVYLKFDDELEELPVMIGITGSYTCDTRDKSLQYVRIPASEKHKTIGVVTILHQGVRLTDFDSIIGMQLKTIINQQYIGVSPWMEAMKRVDWTQTGSYGGFVNGLAPIQYMELQNYDLRTYLDQVVKYNEATTNSGKVVVYYTPSEDFKHLIQSFDPGELLERINLSIHKGEKYKTQIVNMEILRFRERPLIPVFTHENFSPNTSFLPGSYSDPQTLNEIQNGQHTFYVSTTPEGYPHPIESLTEFEMLDPYCMFEVYKQDYTTEDWVPLEVEGYPYYDPYYRTWARANYDPTVKMDYEWKQVMLLDRYDSIEQAAAQDNNLILVNNKLVLNPDCEEYQELYNNSLWIDLITYQNYLILKPDSRYMYRRNIWHQDNKKKKENGKYVTENPITSEMYDFEMTLYNIDEENQLRQYFYTDHNGNTQFIKENAYDLYYKSGKHYYAIGTTTVESNKSYYIKSYNVVLNLTTEKEITYKNPALVNSYHIGNGVIAELTFQLRVVDYYTEIYDKDVAQAKEDYLNAKEFYTELLTTYTTIAHADERRRKYYALMELYYAMLNGNKGFNLTGDEYQWISNIMSSSEMKKELELLSFYNITMINSVYDSDALELLLDYKQENSDDDLVDAFAHAEVYYYYDETNNEIIDTYYVLDNRKFTAPGTNSLYIEDNKYTLTDDNTVTYRYKSKNGYIYFYKVDKESYLNSYSDPSVSKENLTIIYDPTGITNKFQVVLKTKVISDGENVYELIPQKEEVTYTYIDLLSEAEVEALKVEDYYLGIEPITDQNMALYEETEINDILNGTPLQGAATKYQAINSEINKMDNDLTVEDSTKSNLETAYIDNFNTMLSTIEDYNKKVYKWWCAQTIIDLTNWDAQIDWMTNNPDGFQTTEAGLKNAWLNMCKDVKLQANTRVLSEVEQVSKVLKAAENLYDILVSDTNYIISLQTMQSDVNENTNELDTFLSQQGIITVGKVVLQTYALRDALVQAIDLLNSGKISVLEGLGDFSATCIDYIDKFNTIRDNRDIFTAAGLFSTTYRNITDMVNKYYDNYIEIWNQEKVNYSNPNYLNLTSMAKISNYYDDIMYLKNSIAVAHSAITYEGHTLSSIPSGAATINSGVINYNNENFINILSDQSDINYYKDQVLNMTQANRTLLNNGSYKDIETYFYRTSLLTDNLITNRRNIFAFFILNPLSDWYYDVRLPYQDLYQPAYNGGNQTNSGNIRYFNLLSAEAQKVTLEVHNMVLDYMIELLEELEGTSVLQYRLYIVRNYNIELPEGSIGAEEQSNEEKDQDKIKFYNDEDEEFNLFKIRKDIMADDGAVGSIMNMIQYAKEQIIAEKGANYILRNFGDPNATINAVNVEVYPNPFSRDDRKLGIPYDATLTEENKFSMGTNWYQPIYIETELLNGMTKLIEDAQTKNYVLDQKGIYWEYLDLFYQTSINEVTDLLNQAKVLQRLYEKQTDVYSTKFDTYKDLSDYNQALYSSYFGTKAYQFYNEFKDQNMSDIDREALMKKYKDEVYNTWWDFLNLLDARYSAEKEGGMYA